VRGSMGDAPAESSYLGSLYNLGASALKYGYDTVSSYVGYDGGDLDIVDPNAEGSQEVKEIDANDERQSFFVGANFSKYVGMDVTSLLSVPVWIMEPFSVTQKVTEIMEYSELMDLANDAEDPFMRQAYMVAYLVSPFSCIERTYKPFNPILGETFEYTVPGKFRFFSEQVSHHPPICAAHGESESDKWTYDIVSAPKSKFLGNSVEIYPLGRTRIKLHTPNETFILRTPHAKANNIVVGSTWIDVFGSLAVKCVESGIEAHVDFTQCGWFGAGRYEFKGYIVDADGKKVMLVSGKWNSHCDAVRCDADGNPADGAETHRLWESNPKPEDPKYKFTQFAKDLNTVPAGAPEPLPSDARRRPDRFALMVGDSVKAGEQKSVLEDRQRAEKRERTKREEPWEPRWFVAVSAEEVVNYDFEAVNDIGHWKAKPGFFQQQAERAGAKNEDVEGAGFCPWQFPELPTGEAA